MNFVFRHGEWPSVAIAGRAERFPVHRIYCVGSNYADHKREMGGSAEREPPIFFSKPADAAVPGEAPAAGHEPSPVSVRYPSRTNEFHYEIELVIAIGKGGSNISTASADAHVFGYAAGIDLTRRDLQKQAKLSGTPWEVGKAFDQSAPVSAIVPWAAPGVLERAAIWLKVNGKMRQESDIGEMTWGVRDLIAELSTFYELLPGDLIFTGTPAGVGPLKKGDLIEGGVAGVGLISVRVE